MSFDLVLQDFCGNFGRADIDFGLVEYKLNGNGPWPLGVGAGSDLAKFYTDTIFHDKPSLGGFFRFDLVAIDQIEDVLQGWRYIKSEKNIRKIDENWLETWLIFGDKDGDAIFADVAVSRSPVWGSVQKRNFPLSDSLESFLAALLVCMKVEGDDFNFETKDEDFSVKPDFLIATKKALSVFLDDSYVDGFMYFFFG